MLISDIMNVIVSKKAILDIWNNIDIRNTFSFLLVTIELFTLKNAGLFQPKFGSNMTNPSVGLKR